MHARTCVYVWMFLLCECIYLREIGGSNKFGFYILIDATTFFQFLLFYWILFLVEYMCISPFSSNWILSNAFVFSITKDPFSLTGNEDSSFSQVWNHSACCVWLLKGCWFQSLKIYMSGEQRLITGWLPVSLETMLNYFSFFQS